MTVVTTYASNFTPRVVQKFINKPNVLSLFGIFVGGFFYTVLSLFFLQNIAADQPVLSGTIGILYAIASMVYFILFVKRVLRDIKGGNLIADIYAEAQKLIAVEADSRKSSERWSEENIGDTYQLYSKETGYFYGIDYDRVFALIEDLQCELIIQKKIGEYVPKGVYIANFNVQEKADLTHDETAKLFEKISDCFIMNVSRNETHDYHHEITNLVEIALRAISPGINDPNTAIICLRHISLLLGQLFSSENQFIVARENDHAKVIYESYSIESELYLSFYQIIFYGKQDPSVAYAILDGLFMIYMAADSSAYSSIEKFFEETYQICYAAQSTEMDQEHLRLLKDDFIFNRDKKSDKDVMREEEER